MRALSFLLFLPLLFLFGCDDEEVTVPQTFRVTIENVGADTTVNGQPFLLSPGVWAVHTPEDVLFADGDPASEGLERLAEDGDPAEMAAELSDASGVLRSGTFTAGVNADTDGPIMPGDRFEFTVIARPGDRLSLATMFAQSNDLFYAFDPEGIVLFDGDDPVTGDVTEELILWDAGTEVNEEPGTGPNQAPRQSDPDTGADEASVVRPVDAVDDGYTYPSTSSVIRVTLTPQ